MSKKTTYLLPIWIDLTCENHKLFMQALNYKLTEFFEEECDLIANFGGAVNVQWSVNKHVDLEEGEV